MQMALGKGQRANIGYVLSSEQFALPQLIEFGTQAEQAGFDTIWTSDHFQPWQDNEGHASFAFVTLAALGQRVQVPVGTGVTCPTYRYNPAVVAQAFTSLSLLNPGKIFLGVGTGEALNEQAATGDWGDYEERADRLIEAVQLIRKLWTGEEVNHNGQYYQVKAKLYDTPAQPIPIYIAASGDKSMHLAGKYGDGLISDSETATKPEMRKAFEEGAREAGKDPSQMPIIAEHWVFVGKEEEAKKYAKLWQFLPKAWDVFVDNPNPVEIRKQAEQMVKVDEIVKMWTVSEDPQKHIQKLQELIDKGVSTIFVHSAQPDQKKFIEFYQRHILPQLQQNSSQSFATTQTAQAFQNIDRETSGMGEAVVNPTGDPAMDTVKTQDYAAGDQANYPPSATTNGQGYERTSEID